MEQNSYQYNVQEKVCKGPAVQNANSPHFWWLICILGGTIIALFAYALTCQVCCAKMIMEYISYASVLLSITLSVFAILYTYTSNVQIQQQFEKINYAANRITSTSDNLSTTGQKLDENLDVILKRLENIDNKQTEMTAQISMMNNNSPDNEIKISNIPTQK